MQTLNVDCYKPVRTVLLQATRRMLSKAWHVMERKVGSRGSG